MGSSIAERFWGSNAKSPCSGARSPLPAYATISKWIMPTYLARNLELKRQEGIKVENSHLQNCHNTCSDSTWRSLPSTQRHFWCGAWSVNFMLSNTRTIESIEREGSGTFAFTHYLDAMVVRYLVYDYQGIPGNN
jgi:hypothetical protein